LFTWSVFVSLWLFLNNCVEEILGIKPGMLRGRGVWVAGIRNVHLIICIKWARLVAYMRLIKEHIC